MGILILVPGCATIPIPPMNAHPPTPSTHFRNPLPNARVISRFGKRGKRYHTGIDLQANQRGGDTIIASRGGVVIEARVRHGYGKTIVIKHADGYRTRYAHLKKWLVSQGSRVAAGEAVGLVGATGRASTPHLHFEIIDPNGRFVNPATLLFPANAGK